MICGYCGKEFDEKHAGAGCSQCGLSKGCGMLRCPFCGFEQPREVGWLKKLFQGKSKKAQGTMVCGLMTIANLERGQTAVVVDINKQSDEWRKLMVFGIMPGVKIKCAQTFPAYVIRVGETEIALDKETAQLVYIKLE